MAIVDRFLPANRGSGSLLLFFHERFSCIFMLFVSWGNWFIGIESEVFPEVELSSEIGVDLTEEKVMGIAGMLSRLNDVEALEV